MQLPALRNQNKNLCSAAKPRDFTSTLPCWSCCRHSWPVFVLCASSVCEFMCAMSQFFRTICALEIKMTLLCHGAMRVETSRWCWGAVGLSDATREQTQVKSLRLYFHPVSLNITSTQYTGGEKLNKTQQPDATYIWCFYKKTCSLFTLKWVHLTWICIALAVMTIWFGRLKVKKYNGAK